jgi:seryl-tRNA synthetase
LKEALITLEEDLAQLTDKLQLEAQIIPNFTHPDVPVGGEENSVVRKEVVHFFTYFLLLIVFRTFDNFFCLNCAGRLSEELQFHDQRSPSARKGT